MQLTYSGGTAQQRAWAADGVAACAFPLDSVNAVVTITWQTIDPQLAHPYMHTTAHGDGTFTITIEPWADDPTNPNLRGLPDPRSDIKDFYMQSLVHEIGHIVHLIRITTDDQKQAIAALFWTPEPNSATGRRFGTLADYSTSETTDLSWASAIIEAIAECIKCTFFKGRLVFMNRTLWRIDPQEWNPFLLLLFGAGTGFDETWAADAHNQPVDAAAYETLQVDLAGMVVPEGLTASVQAGYHPTSFIIF